LASDYELISARHQNKPVITISPDVLSTKDWENHVGLDNITRQEELLPGFAGFIQWVQDHISIYIAPGLPPSEDGISYIRIGKKVIRTDRL